MKRQWNEGELDAHWTLTVEEQALLPGRTGHGRFGFAILLKSFQYEGQFPDSRREVPAEVVRHLAEQLAIPLKALDSFDWQGRTAKRQRTEILSWLGIRRMTAADWDALALWLRAELLPGDHSPEQLAERTDDWLRGQGLESPGANRLGRLLRAEAHAYESRLLTGIADHISDTSRTALDRLLGAADDRVDDPETGDTPEPEREISFSHLRRDAGRVSLETLLQELAKLEAIRELALPTVALTTVPPKWLQKFRQRASVESIWDLRRHPTHIRYGLAAAFCFQR